MASKTQSQIQSDIDVAITDNSAGDITGPVLNTVLNDSIESVINIVVGGDIINNLESGSEVLIPFTVRSPAINFKSTGNTDIFTVPSGREFLINQVSLITTSSLSVASGEVLADISVGDTSDRDSIYQARRMVTTTGGAREIYGPKACIGSGTTVSFTVNVASDTTTANSGYCIMEGYLMGA